LTVPFWVGAADKFKMPLVALIWPPALLRIAPLIVPAPAMTPLLVIVELVKVPPDK